MLDPKPRAAAPGLPLSVSASIGPMNELATYNTLMTLFNVVNCLFACAFGACLGSLINVLAYRMPLGLNVVSPPSRCPNCETKLTWRENIPIFGWLALGGKCRFCRTPISAEYPIVETIVAALFGLIFLKVYSEGPFLGLPIQALSPSWGQGSFPATWPTLLAILTLVSCLVAITLIDARTFFIPLSLTWIPAAAAFVLNGVQLVLVDAVASYHKPHFASGWDWSIATPSKFGWPSIGAAIGGGVGLLLSNVLLACGVFKRSYHDYDAWLAEREAALGPGASLSAADPHLWLEYPHARREAIREVCFLTPAIGLAYWGSKLAARWAGPWRVDLFSGYAESYHQAPLWLTVLCGVLLGYLVGGGAVWFFRIVGTLVKGQDAMGMGDVHMMAAVGACFGWPIAVLGFFAAAFVGVFWNFRRVLKLWRIGPLTQRISGHRRQLGVLLKHGQVGTIIRLLSGSPQQMPFGPYLAIGTMLVWYFQPLVERLLGPIFRTGERFTLP
jgi:leader peptidase (prepilin peptidase) / N-methyltransferase